MMWTIEIDSAWQSQWIYSLAGISMSKSNFNQSINKARHKSHRSTPLKFMSSWKIGMEKHWTSAHIIIRKLWMVQWSSGLYRCKMDKEPPTSGRGLHLRFFWTQWNVVFLSLFSTQVARMAFMRARHLSTLLLQQEASRHSAQERILLGL